MAAADFAVAAAPALRVVAGVRPTSAREWSTVHAMAQAYKTVIGGIIHCREAPTRQGLNFLNTERILMKRKRQEPPRQAAFVCVICAGFQLVPNSVIGSYWWRGSQNPDSEFRVLYVCGPRPPVSGAGATTTTVARTTATTAAFCPSSRNRESYLSAAQGPSFTWKQACFMVP